MVAHWSVHSFVLVRAIGKMLPFLRGGGKRFFDPLRLMNLTCIVVNINVTSFMCDHFSSNCKIKKWLACLIFVVQHNRRLGIQQLKNKYMNTVIKQYFIQLWLEGNKLFLLVHKFLIMLHIYTALKITQLQMWHSVFNGPNYSLLGNIYLLFV